MKKESLLLCALSLVAFAVVAFLTVRGKLQAFNVMLAQDVQALETPTLTGFFKILSHAGEWFVYVPAGLLLLSLPKTRIHYGLPAAVILAASSLLNWLLKLAFAIPRPSVNPLILPHGYGFPSGHAMIGTAFVGALAVLCLRSSLPKTGTVFLVASAVIFILLTGFGRVYLGVHTPGDVLAGYAAGIFVCAALLPAKGCYSTPSMLALLLRLTLP